MVANIILLFFTKILNSPLRNRISGNGFLQKQIAFILLILDNAPHTTVRPFCHTFFIEFPQCFQTPCYGISSVSLQIQFKNQSHGFCFCLIHRNGFVFRVIIITETSVKAHQLPTLHFHLDAHLHILGCGLHLILCQCSHKGKHHFALLRHGIDIFLFKDNRYAPFLQQTDILKNINCISGKS